MNFKNSSLIRFDYDYDAYFIQIQQNSNITEDFKLIKSIKIKELNILEQVFKRKSIFKKSYNKIMKKRMSSHKQLCLRQNCCGVKNQHQNFLAATNRHHNSTSRMKKSDIKKTIQKKKPKAQPKQSPQVNKILQQSYNQMKQQNTRLIKKVNSKKKRIQQLQQKVHQHQQSIQNYTLQIEHFQSLLKGYEQKKYSEDTNQKNIKGQKYQNIIQAQQALTKQTLEKYKSLEKQYEHYRQIMEKRLQAYQQRINRLEKENISMENKLEIQKKYQNQVQGIKKQLNKFQDKQSRSLRQNSDTIVNSLQSQLAQARQKNRLLQEELLCVSSKLKQNQLAFQHRQQQLLSNLDKISQKVSRFEIQTKNVHQKTSNQSSEWKIKYQDLSQKYMQKKQKYFQKNEEWAQIFKEFMIQIDRLKRQIAYISERNVKLVQLYVQGQTKDN